MKRAVLPVVLFVLTLGVAYGHDVVLREPTAPDLVLPDLPGEEQLLPKVPNSEAMDDTTREAYCRSLRAYYDYRVGAFQHRSNVYIWQLRCSYAIFVMVLVLVLAGIYFAGIQFHAGLRTRGKSSAEATTLKASGNGIEVSSPVLGVIILVISLLFFFLYLKFVYPIQESI